MQALIAYLGAALIFAALDLIWLSTSGPRLYRPLMGGLMADKIALPPALLFYLLYVGGIVLFAVMPALEANSWRKALLYGAALGLLAYGTYDLTNQATLKDWPLRLTLIDMSWGVVVSAAGALGGYFLAQRFG